MPCPALTTLPTITSSTASGLSCAASRAAWMTCPAKAPAEHSLSEPPKAPIAERFAPTI
ncbi:Uncharacterised protein [Vibrio cholerae]|nr:Uncharacterised protein [Vibrio cholerae]CSI65724.1 Uncharacterised protein [Vibrio cholerae]